MFVGCFCSTPSSFCKDFQGICIQFYTWLFKIVPKLILNIRISYDLNIWHVLPISLKFSCIDDFLRISQISWLETPQLCEFNPSKAIVAFTEAFRMLEEVFTSVQRRCNNMWGSTVDGRNPDNQLRLVVYPIIYRVLYSGAGFLPSTVCQMLQLFFSLAKPKYEDLCGAILWVSYQAPVLSEEAGIQSKAGISIFLLGI